MNKEKRSPHAGPHQLPLVAALTAAVALGNGCDPGPADDPDPAAAPGEEETVVLSVWAHSGPETERWTLREQIGNFNMERDDIHIELHMIPRETFHSQVLAAAGDEALPDLLVFDDIYLPSFAEEGCLRPMDNLIAASTREDFLPSIIEHGSWEDHLYALSGLETGIAQYISFSRFVETGGRIPRTFYDTWTIDEFDETLAALFEANGGRPVLDLKMNYDAEWFADLILPLLRSAGADLVDRETYETAEGVVNSPEAVNAMKRIQAWFENGYVDPNEDDDAFVDERAAISWSGHWDFPAYHDSHDSNVRLIPLPDFGNGSRAIRASWMWAITSDSDHPEASMEFLEAIFATDQILALSNATNRVPGRISALDRSSYFGTGAVAGLFARQLEEIAVSRPRIPAYPEIAAAFEPAFREISQGADVQETLDDLAREIDARLAGEENGDEVGVE